MRRSTWGSRLGFIFAAAGSAVGLANIWRLPYIVGANGGAAFLMIYFLCLLLIGFPVLISEILIGKTTHLNPKGAFEKLGGKPVWGWAGKLTIFTGFLVSSFYSAVAGWILGYLIEALTGNITQFTDTAQSTAHYEGLISNPVWGLGFHFLFLGICTSVLYFGVRGGIERGNKIMMPCLFIVLTLLMFKGLSLSGAFEGIKFLFSPDWSELTPLAIVTAMGQAFFTLSLGQGTMITYGSYLGGKDNLVKSCFPIVLMDTVISVMAAVTVFTIVFSGGMEPDSGPGLIFHTLPMIFSQMQGGYIVAVMFFLLVLLAAITSQISAMEPAIAYLIDQYKWNRHPATLLVALGVFAFGVPSAISSSLLQNATFYDLSFLGFMDFLASRIFIPLGGFLAVFLVGWIWGADRAMVKLKDGSERFFKRYPFLSFYFSFCFKYVAPVLMVIVFLNALGVFR